jgi:hypothetical protein
VVRRELGKSNRIRLRKLLEATDERHAMSAVTTHVLDTARGVPAAGVQVWLEQVCVGGRTEIARTRTGSDGRAASLDLQRLLSAPNKHHVLADLSRFGLDNPGEVFPAADRPYGLIQCAVQRDDAEDPGPAWDSAAAFEG